MYSDVWCWFQNDLQDFWNKQAKCCSCWSFGHLANFKSLILVEVNCLLLEQRLSYLDMVLHHLRGDQETTIQPLCEHAWTSGTSVSQGWLHVKPSGAWGTHNHVISYLLIYIYIYIYILISVKMCKVYVYIWYVSVWCYHHIDLISILASSFLCT